MRAAKQRCNLLFPIPVGVIQYEEFEEINERIMEEIDAVDWDQHHKELGMVFEADHTKAEDTFINMELVPSCKPILQAFIRACNDFAQHLTWDVDPQKTRLNGYWAHITEPGDRTALHTHVSSDPVNHWSGAYYVKAAKDCGKLNFTDARLARKYEPHIKEPNKVYSLFAEYTPQEGLMIIFPSWLEHRVGLNNSNERRVSLSFNASLCTLWEENR